MIDITGTPNTLSFNECSCILIKAVPSLPVIPPKSIENDDCNDDCNTDCCETNSCDNNGNPCNDTNNCNENQTMDCDCCDTKCKKCVSTKQTCEAICSNYNLYKDCIIANNEALVILEFILNKVKDAIPVIITRNACEYTIKENIY